MRDISIKTTFPQDPDKWGRETAAMDLKQKNIMTGKLQANL